MILSALSQPVKPRPMFLDMDARLVFGEVVTATSDGCVLEDAFGELYFLPKTECPQNEVPSIGRTLALMPEANTVPGQPSLSSAVHPDIVLGVLEGVVPEVRSGKILVMGVARAPGVRTKVAVATTEAGIDPVKSCVGRQASRVNRIKEYLGGERVDIVAWHDVLEDYVRAALSPAEVTGVSFRHAADNPEKAVAIVVSVPQHQMPAVVGHGGLNSRLASTLIGARVEAQSTLQN